MAKEQPWKDEGLTKAEWIEREVAAAVNAGKAWDLETVDYSDPNRPLTCLEVDFPIIPINQIAAIEGNAGKPIYQMSKWWARRRSSVFRSMLLAAAIKAPDDPAEAAKLVWDVYYGNHQQKDTFKHLKVADVFMGGGTTVVEGSRLGMQMYGNDLNPVAWFVVKNELTQIQREDVESLLAEIEESVKPQIMPFYACDCPRGHKGSWTKTSTGEVMPDGFDPLALTPEQRKEFQYEGPQALHTFWAKHGPCQVTGCGHRTPIMSSPVMAVKTISVKAWQRTCKHCGEKYDFEERDARMAPGVPLFVADSETPFAIAKLNLAGHPESVVCPHCHTTEKIGQLPKPGKKKVKLTLLVHPNWLRGEAGSGPKGESLGGGHDDPVDATLQWYALRASKCSLIEYRGDLPDEFVMDDGTLVRTGHSGGTIPKKSHFTCGECGTAADVLKTMSAYQKSPPVAAFAYQGYCPVCEAAGEPYGGRFFVPASDVSGLVAAELEWAQSSNGTLAPYWPQTALPTGFKTTYQRLPEHGYPTFWKLFNARQLLTHCRLGEFFSQDRLRALPETEYVIGAFQQFLRNACMFSFWHRSHDHFAPALSNNNYHPKPIMIDVGPFTPIGYGPWPSTTKALPQTCEWQSNPWEIVSNERTEHGSPHLRGLTKGKGTRVCPGDPVIPGATLTVGSSTELSALEASSVDLVITDPPFGNNIQYSELADFFYVWLRQLLGDRYPDVFGSELTPKAMEAVTNPVRNASEPEAVFARLLKGCWQETNRILKPGGLLAFTFHHSEDAPWVSVLESLFEAGFVLHATFPIRSDETKGEGAKPGTFGSQLIEYDVVHVCRKRTEAPARVSWAKLRRQVLQDVRGLQELLEHHQEDGLPEADLQVIRRGKALEYFSRHYGEVYKNPDTPMSVMEALLGINQLLDEEAGGIKEPPPHNAEPFTRMMLRLFDGTVELPRDQMQKFLRGTGSAPSDFIGRGWVTEKKKVFYLVPPLDIAREWVGKQRRGMTSDYDQAMYLIGACFENSGINATETLNNANFRPHPALGAILTWFKTHGADSPTRNAAITASQLYKAWEAKNQPKAKELTLFDMLGEDD